MNRRDRNADQGHRFSDQGHWVLIGVIIRVIRVISSSDQGHSVRDQGHRGHSTLALFVGKRLHGALDVHETPQTESG